MRNILRPFILPCVVLSLTSAAFAIGDTESLRQTAQSLYRDGHYAQSTKIYLQIAADNPQNVALLKEAMWALWNMQKFDDAKRLASEVQILKPEDIEAHNILTWAQSAANRDEMSDFRQRALAHYKNGEYGEAASLYRQLADLDPNDLSTLKDWMSALWASHQYEETDRVARRILAIRPADPHALDMEQKLPSKIAEEKIKSILNQTGPLDKEGQLAVTIKLNEELVKLRPDDPSAYRNLAWAYYKLKRYAEARVVASLLTTLIPDDPDGWNLQARIAQGLKDRDAAKANYEKSLELNNNQPAVLLAMGKLYLQDRDFNPALTYLQRALAIPGSHQADAYPLLAKALFWLDRFTESAELWEKAAALFPNRPEFQFQHAMAVYYSGQHDKAIAELKDLYTATHYDPAASFLADDDVEHGDPHAGEDILASTMDNAPTLDEARAMRLADLYATYGPKKKLMALLKRVLQQWPNHTSALLIKADELRDEHQYSEAKKTYEKLLAINPYCLDAIMNLAETEISPGHGAAALNLAKRLREWDPAGLDYALFEARILYDRDQYAASKKVLKQWLKVNEGQPPLTILLYHGLTPLQDDAILAYPYHHSIQTFENQLKALKEDGYTTVSLSDVDAWLDHRGELPSKPLIICFDDARADSFKFADPILEKYGFKASMFVPIANIEGNEPIGYVSWTKLDEYRKTGRWEIQAHGDEAHVRQPLDNTGLYGPFLANRSWIESERRVEGIEEWKIRIDNDYDSSRQKIYDHLGITPIGYAFPEGVYGQQDQVNVPDAAPTNRQLVMKHFHMAFTQDSYGINLPTYDRALLTRTEPNNQWTGKRLLDHLHDSDPFNRVYMELLNLANEEGRVQEALSWWKRLKQNGASEHTLAGQEAIIRLTAGDYAEGRALAQRALAADSIPETKQTIENYLAKEKWTWLPGFYWHTEDPQRTDWWVGQTLELPRWQNGLKLSATYRYEEFNEANFPVVDGHAAGLGLNYPMGISNEFDLRALQHLFTSPAESFLEAEGDWKNQWTDAFSSRLAISREPEPTDEALNDHISYDQALLQLHWFEESAWTAEGSERYRYYSDQNVRSTSEFLLARRVWSFLNLRGVLHVTYDATKFRAPQYYSPQSLWMPGLGPEISWDSRQWSWKVSYWPSYSMEHDLNSQWDENVEVEMSFHVNNSLSLKPTYNYYQNPGYSEHTAELQCEIRF
jgi:Flp pilus assembly protein TadD/peptidoglycan/xylan/chitin deacetylase (PgdA/CDA1 family)